MNKSRKFNNILDECLERLLVKSEAMEQCLQSYPEQAAELEPLLKTALATKKASVIQPRPEFMVKARYDFRLALKKIERKTRFPFLGWQPRWAMSVAVVLVLLLVGGGTAVAAGNSMPDNLLYPVKLATEQVRLTLTPSNIGKAELYANLVDKRVAEIICMANKGKPERLEQTTQRLNSYLSRVASLAAPQKKETEVLLAPAPSAAPSEPTRAGKDAHVQANGRAKLKMTLEHYVSNHTARLRTVLETAPEAAKPALRRAIAVSVAGYKKALEALD